MINSRSESSSAPAGYRFPREVIAVAVRWYLRYGLSYRDVEELLAERGVEVDHVTVYRWVQTFTPEFIDAARPARHAAGDRWFVDETYVKVAGRWTYLYRAIDQYGQVIDVLRLDPPRRRSGTGVLHPRTAAAARRRSRSPPTGHRSIPRVLDELMPAALHVTEQYANNVIEADHGRLKVTATADARTQTTRAPRAPSPPATPSCRTCAAATTRSSPNNRHETGSAPHSSNSRSASDCSVPS